MAKLEQLQPSKLISAYGGVGSIIETVHNGSLRLCPYNEWKCFDEEQKGERKEIKDERLLQHLKVKYGMSGLKRILQVPTPDQKENKWGHKNGDEDSDSILAERFPQWYICPTCSRIEKYERWERSWRERWANKKKEQSFNGNPPACNHCSKERGEGISRRVLEQIRYVMVSLSGELKDIPFRKLVAYAKAGRSLTGVIDLKDVENDRDCELSWMMRSSDGVEEALVLVAKFPNGQENIDIPMVSLQHDGVYIKEDGVYYKVYLRNQNNLYYPEVTDSLYIPQYADAKIVEFIMKRHGKGRPIDSIVENLEMEDKTLDREEVAYIIENQSLDFERQEYHFITDPNLYDEKGWHREWESSFRAIRYQDLGVPMVSHVYALERLKKTSVALSYTRLTPKGSQIPWWDEAENKLKLQDPKPMLTYAKKLGPPIDYVPGIERYGEGLFFELDKEQLERIESDKRETFVHTLSHAIMRELEFSSGYTLASLQERLYVFDDGRAGILIYTTAATYGGLSALCDKDSSGQAPIVRLVEQAVKRSSRCVNDPICKEHCHVCLELPEVSCALWNDKLDRGLLAQIPL